MFEVRIKNIHAQAKEPSCLSCLGPESNPAQVLLSPFWNELRRAFNVADIGETAIPNFSVKRDDEIVPSDSEQRWELNGTEISRNPFPPGFGLRRK